MTKFAATNRADVATLDVDEYSQIAMTAFPMRSVWYNAVAPDRIYHIPVGASGTIVSKYTGPAATATAHTSGDDLTDTVAVHSTTTLAWADYYSHHGISSDVVVGAPGNLLKTLLKRGLEVLPEQYDLCAATVAQACSTSTYFERMNGRVAITDIVADDKLTMAYVKKAHSKLSKQNAPKFFINGMQVYMAFVHTDVAHDLKNEASGLLLGAPANVNANEVRANFLGIAGGFAFFESNVAAMVEANAGSGGTVDVYNSIFLGADSLAFCDGPIPSVPGALDIPVNETGSQLVRLTTPLSNAGMGSFVTCWSRIGFARIDEAGIYRIESSSSLGTNT